MNDYCMATCWDLGSARYQKVRQQTFDFFTILQVSSLSGTGSLLFLQRSGIADIRSYPHECAGYLGITDLCFLQYLKIKSKCTVYKCVLRKITILPQVVGSIIYFRIQTLKELSYCLLFLQICKSLASPF